LWSDITYVTRYDIKVAPIALDLRNWWIVRLPPDVTCAREQRTRIEYAA